MNKTYAIKSAALVLPILMALGCQTVPRCPAGSEYDQTSRNCRVDAAMGVPVDAARPDAGPPATDSGVPDDGGPAMDGGPGTDAGPADAGPAPVDANTASMDAGRDAAT